VRDDDDHTERTVPVGEMVSFPSNGDTCDGYLAVPESGSGPGVIVIQEWWGLVDHIKDLADRFAAEGYVALAPDLFHGVSTTEPDEAGKLLMGLAMDRAAKDIAGAATYLAGRDDVTSTGIGCVGFCMGGSLALWSATVSDDVKVAVGFYPAIPWQKMDPEWSNYSGKYAMIHTSEDDGSSDAESIQQAAKGIEQAGGEVEVYDYPGTHHAFVNDTRPEAHNQDAADTAMRRTFELLSSRLR
jgi:carboxymethylenebutenolidase